MLNLSSSHLSHFFCCISSAQKGTVLFHRLIMLKLSIRRAKFTFGLSPLLSASSSSSSSSSSSHPTSTTITTTTSPSISLPPQLLLLHPPSPPLFKYSACSCFSAWSSCGT